MSIAIALTAAAFAWAEVALADEAPIRSDLPFWAERGPSTWPKTTQDGIGSTSNTAIGDWRITSSPCDSDENDCTSWLRLGLVGFWEGGFYLAQTHDRSALGASSSEPAVLVDLGSGPTAGEELFAFEIGMRGGSRYMLLSTKQRPLIKQFSVLAGECETPVRGVRRMRARIQTFARTDYCLVETPEALLRLARDAARRPAIATVEWVGPLPPGD